MDATICLANKKFLSLNILETNVIFLFDGVREWEEKQTTLKFPDFTQGQLVLMLRTNQLRNNMLSRWAACSLTKTSLIPTQTSLE